MTQNHTPSRRTFLKATGSAAVVGLSGCAGDSNGDGGDGGGSDGGQTGTPGEDPVRIGLLLPLSGAFVQTGEINRLGAELGREAIGGQILGRDVEFVVQDTESESATATQGAEELVQRENVDAIIGPASSSSGLAVMPYIQNEGQVPMITTTVSSIEARENPDNCNRYTFFIWPSNRHLVPTGVDFIQALPDHVDRDFDPSRVHFVSPDYSLGQNNLALLEEEMQSVGGEVTGSTLVPLGTEDWSSYISEIEQSEADVVTGVLTWGSATPLIQQASEFGLAESKVMMFNSGKPVGQYIASTLGEEANGWFGTHFYNPELDTEVNNEFKSLYQETDSDILPNSAAGGGYEPVRSLAMAMEQAGTTETDAVIDNLEGLQWDSIFGPISYRESDHQVRMNFYGAVRRDGVFTALEEYEGVIGPAECDV